MEHPWVEFLNAFFPRGGDMKCSKHPRYKGIYKPRTKCKGCIQVMHDRRMGEAVKAAERRAKAFEKAALRRSAPGAYTREYQRTS